MFDMSQALYAKLWWRFRTQNSLWSIFMWNKYCKKQIPNLVQWKGGSQLWKSQLMNRDIIEQHMWWEPREALHIVLHVFPQFSSIIFPTTYCSPFFLYFLASSSTSESHLSLTPKLNFFLL